MLSVVMSLAVILAAALWASDPAIAQNPAPPQQPAFRTHVTLVTTDVIPRDGDGRFISDLTRDSFIVLEDGQPQTIVSFALVHGGRTFHTLTPPPLPVPEGIVLPNASRGVVTDTAGRVLLVLVDDLHFEPEYTPHVRRLIETLATTLLHDGDLMAMVSSGPSGDRDRSDV